MEIGSSKLKNEQNCSGCGACIAVCPKNAIEKCRTGLDAWLPVINEDLCINCGLCEKVCRGDNTSVNEHIKRAYVAYNKEQNIRQKSASGGVFSALATYVLDCGGSVFGAELYFENGQVVVEHNMITQIKELPRLLGSKYVQSDTVKAYRQVKKELLQGKMVLFSGCSCQIAGLKNYLGEIDMTNLYTIDLICHGVPSIGLLQSYISFLEKKHGGRIKSLSFRTKEKGKIDYKITTQVDDTSGGVILQTIFRVDIVMESKGLIMKEIKIPIHKSGYYLAFMGQQSYRSSCYHCPYASLDKPADITIGDYFEVNQDYPELFLGDEAIDENGGVSCVIAHTPKGQQLLDKAVEYIYLKEVSPLKVRKSHLNLQRPSVASFERDILIKGYEKHGYSFIDKYYKVREPIIGTMRKIKGLIKK